MNELLHTLFNSSLSKKLLPANLCSLIKKNRITGRRKQPRKQIEIKKPLTNIFTLTGLKEYPLKEEHVDIELLTYSDSLTGLPNKACLKKKLNELGRKPAINDEISLISLDIDNFKNINEIFGHNYGDELIVSISSLLRLTLASNCSLFRWDGDEFLILLETPNQSSQIIDTIKSIRASLMNAFMDGDWDTFITVSIGVSVYPNECININDLIKNSEIAMYHAKSNGKNNWFFYNNDLHNKLVRDIHIEKYLRTSISDHELTLLYQPQYDMLTCSVIGYEALLRWNNDELGEISPREFIPVAEQSTLILMLGNWVLQSACRQNKLWIELGIGKIMSINISVVQFEQENFVYTIEEILKETGMPPKYLVLEISETTLVKCLSKSIDKIEKLKLLGVRVTLDNFGTGYSSLNCLKELPIDNLKIEKSFIDDINTNSNSKAILNGIIQLAHAISLTVLAEGIESFEQLDLLKELNCDIIQGFYYCEPISSTQLQNLMLNIN